MRSKRLLIVAALVLEGTVAAVAGRAAATITPTSSALDIAQAIAAPSANVTGASFASVTGGSPNGVSTTALGGFPIDGPSFGILTTGDVSQVASPGTFASTDNGGGNVRGNTDYDVSVLKIDLNVPGGANCLSFDFKFLSEEFPYWVGTQFNDAFIAELDTSDWTTSGSAITAPHNFAVDSSHHVVSIDSTGLGGMTAAEGAGTAFDGGNDGTTWGGATGLLRAQTPVGPGSHSVYLSIFDQGDHIYDSAVFLDDLVVGTASAGQCTPGAETVVGSVRTGVGLRNSDDQGTQFDLMAELLDGSDVVATGVERCITGVARNPSLAKEVTIGWSEGDPAIGPDDSVSIRFSTRIGTKPDGSKCTGPGGSHSNVVGLRLYYDAKSRPSQLEMPLDPTSVLYLHSDGNPCGSTESTGVTNRFLDLTAPTAANAKCKDSSSLNFAGGNQWKVIGTWTEAP